MVLLLFVSAIASGATIKIYGSSGPLAASAFFEASGTNLVLTFSNISLKDVMEPSEVLTALFWNGPAYLNPVSVVLTAGSSVLFGGADLGGIAGGEWAFRCGLVGAPADCGFSSAGFGLFGSPDLFPGNNLQGPASPDGVQYGLTSKGDNPLTGNSPVTGDNALIQFSVTATFSGLPAGFDPATGLSNFSFQYGTDLSEPRFGEVSEPATLSLFGFGLAGLVLASKKLTQ